MPKKTSETDGLNYCSGGISYNCRHDSHPRGKTTFNCRRCRGYLGCSVCAERPAELLCLNCRDWGTDEAEKRHGKLEPRPVQEKKVKEVIANLRGLI